MKVVTLILAFALITLTFAVVHAQVTDCDPDSDGKPNCTAADAGKTYRNFWDPVHYWQCPEGGGEAQSVICPDSELYSASKSQCIPWSDWEWTEPCKS